jgi:periplasmic protein TonB
MEANKILAAPLLDLVFDGRNKDYGAYQLRKTNSVRTRIALSVTISVVALILSVVTMANASKKKGPEYRISDGHFLIDVVDPPPPDIPEPEPEQREPEPVAEVQFTPPEIVPDELAENLMTDIESLDSARISDRTVVGTPDIFETPPKNPGEEGGFIPPKEKEPEDEGPVMIVEVPAKFIGDWTRFLLKNLNPETPVNNNAGPGRYSVVIQFVVDKEGNVSDIKTLTNHGYGMEEEAVRVLKKAPKWEPGIQNGHKVKAYHRQVITFEVNEE